MSTSTKEIENYKDFEIELRQIENVNSWDKLEVDLIGHEHISTKLTKNGKELKLEVAARLNHNDDEIENFSFIVDNVIYETGIIDHTSSSSKISLDFPASFSTTYNIRTFQTEEFKSNGVFKTFYQTDLDNFNTFHYEFETVTYQSKGHDYFYDCLRINLNGIDYDITRFKTETHGYYIFENLDEETFEKYQQICFSIRQAIGFINKFMPGDEEYVFDDSGKMYYSNFIRPAVRGMYKPVSFNPYGFLEVGRSVAEEYYGKLTRISLNVLSDLISEIHTNPDFATAILMILEVTASRSLLLIPSTFSVLIELLSKAIGNNETGIKIPIDDPLLKEKIIEELHNVIDENSDSLSEESMLK